MPEHWPATAEDLATLAFHHYRQGADAIRAALERARGEAVAPLQERIRNLEVLALRLSDRIERQHQLLQRQAERE